MVKASASRAGQPLSKSRPGHTNDFEFGTLVSSESDLQILSQCGSMQNLPLRIHP